MGLVPAKCPNCGAGIKVDSDGKAAICEYCGTPFVVEESIKNYYIIQNITQNIIQNEPAVKEESEFEKLLKEFKNAKDSIAKYNVLSRMKRIYEGEYQVYECEADLYEGIMLGSWNLTLKLDESDKYCKMDIIKWEAEDFDEYIMKPINKAVMSANDDKEKQRLKNRAEYLEKRCETAKEFLEKTDKEEDKEFEDILNNLQKLDNFVCIKHQDSAVFTDDEVRYCFYQGNLYQVSAKNTSIVKPSRDKFGRKYIVYVNKTEFDHKRPQKSPMACRLVYKYIDGRTIISGFISPEPGKEDKPKFMYSDEYFTYCLNTFEQYLRMKDNLCPVCGSPIKPGTMISYPKCKKCKKTLFDMFIERGYVYYMK